MPAKSQAQRAYLNMKFGHDWVVRHHFNNKGKLPAHVGKKAKKSKGTFTPAHPHKPISHKPVSHGPISHKPISHHTAKPHLIGAKADKDCYGCM